MKDTVYISSLTGVRAIAAYMVFLHHYASSDYQTNFLARIFLEFHTGVSIFFVLSGCLIALRYYNQASIDLSWYRTYLVLRVARIFPLVILTTITSLILLDNKNISDWFLSITLLKGFFPEERFIIISQTWSLTVELVFYILAPLIFVISKKRGNLILQFLLIFLTGILISSYNKNFSIEALTSSNLFMMLFTFFGRSFDFFIGIILALLIISDHHIKTFFNSQKHLSFTIIGFILFTSIIFLLISFQSNEFRFGSFSPIGILVHNFFLPVSIAIFLFGLVNEATIFSKLLSSTLFDILGKSSYAFYLIHLGVITNYLPTFFQYNILTFFIGLNVVSILIFYLLERPLNFGVKKIFKII